MFLRLYNTYPKPRTQLDVCSRWPGLFTFGSDGTPKGLKQYRQNGRAICCFAENLTQVSEFWKFPPI